MQTVLYDGSFGGWLSAVFAVYEHRFDPVSIQQQNNYQKSMFGNEYMADAHEASAMRVWKGLSKRISADALEQLYKAFLSELPDMENTLLSYVKYVFHHPSPVEHDFSHPAVLAVSQVAKKVHREKHRMEAFVRFQLTRDQLYYAIIEPDFNVLPLIRKHFTDRYADQRWMIYDARRKYGLYYNLQNTERVELRFDTVFNGGNDCASVYDENELLYQHLWQRYFGSVNIAARKNTKLHIQHMPERYWKYLPEKQITQIPYFYRP